MPVEEGCKLNVLYLRIMSEYWIMMLQRVMIYFCEYRMLHDKAWLIKWVRCLLNFQCNNILMICPNSVATRRCLSRWYIWTPVTFLFSLAAFPFPTNILISRSHISLHWQAHYNSPMSESWSLESLYRLCCWLGLLGCVWSTADVLFGKSTPHASAEKGRTDTFILI